MKKFLKNQKIIIAISAYAILVVFLFYFVILPLVSKIEETKDQIQEGNLNQEMLREKLTELPKIKQQYDALEEHRSLEDVLLDKNNPVALIEKLEKIAQESNNKIKISAQNSQPEKKSSNTKSIKVAEETLISKLPSTEYLQMQVSLTGFYNNIINFINKLEGTIYYFDIVGIKIRQSEENTNYNSSPFNQSSPADSKKTAEEPKEKVLEAILDIVFYTKQ
ncbi:MAG TPA: type II secretion system protein GspM [Candidatus Moranbacteria bacterium]|nr:type II secretion system protein GspM [Candidatus Moranbacteria bacterium]HRZ33628.1 type II secretion system protein GspM [Candidatus Moranbacteria bacterium]